MNKKKPNEESFMRSEDANESSIIEYTHIYTYTSIQSNITSRYGRVRFLVFFFFRNKI